VIVGGLQYASLSSVGALSDGGSSAYWQIVVPHLVVGALGGLLVGGGAALLGRWRGELSHVVPRTWSAVTGAALLTYLIVWTTYWLGRPLIKWSNAAAYAVAAAASVLLGVVLYRLLRAAVRRLEYRGVSARLPVRALAPAVLAVIVGLGLSMPLAVGGARAPRPAGNWGGTSAVSRPNILIILLDATRPDHLSVYGYSRETDPNIKALASTGQVFTRMYAQAASTTPSVATLLSSLYPAVHRANDATDFLSSAVPRLPELLRAAGYRTFGISANANVSPTFGYAQGFDDFTAWKTENPIRLTLLGRFAEDLLGPSTVTRLLREHADLIPVAESITDSTLEWAARNRTALVEEKQPFFMYVHYIDPHYPYRPPAPYDRLYDYRRDPSRRRDGRVDPVALAQDRHRELVARTLDQYDGEIRYADHHVGRLLAGLGAAGLLDNTIVIVTADHGEEFFEHDHLGHGKSTYEEVLWVPFIVAWPGKIPAGSRNDRMLGLIDVMPTLLAVAGVEPPRLVQGTSFAPLLTKPDAALPPRTMFAQVVQPGFSIDMARSETAKFVRHPSGPRQGREEYYDLARDPLERVNLVATAPAAAAVLRKELFVFNDVVARSASLATPERAKKLDRDTERALRSLGYIK
jgi:arylsulfatase A-like enzyme